MARLGISVRRATTVPLGLTHLLPVQLAPIAAAYKELKLQIVRHVTQVATVME